MRRYIKRILAGLVALVSVISAGTFVYIHFIEGDAPARLSLDSAIASDSSSSMAAATAPTSVSIEGTWKPTSASQVGYRVKEVLFGQNTEAVGRTNAVTGSMVIEGSTVKTVDLSVDMTKVSSDQSRRDSQFQGRIMDTANYPTAKFSLTGPITLGTAPADSSVVTAKATGKLTLRGTTKDVTFDLRAQRVGDTIRINGTIPIVWADWNIPNPSNPVVSTADNGELEFLVVFAKS